MRTTESSTPSSPAVHVRHLGTLDYQDAWQQMRDFTDRRDATTPDEIWLLEHPRVFTLGQAGLPEHVLNPGDIPVVDTDRGGQVTYHGPGQLIAYVLIDLKRAGIGVRELVVRMEQAVIALLADYGVKASGDREAPGVYVDGRKIAALGLRIRKGCSYHGLSLNWDMDLEPFSRINPCGIEGLEVTSMAQVGIKADRLLISEKLVTALATTLATTLGNTLT